MPSAIDNILRQIGLYYGIVSRQAFVTLLNSETPDPLTVPQTPSDDETGSVAARFASILLDITDEAKTTPQLIRSIQQNLANATTEQKNELTSKIRICYNGNEDGADTTGVILTPNKRPEITLLGSEKSVQGTTMTDASYNLRSLCEIPDSSPINNGNGEAPSERTFSLIQVFGNKLSPANRDLGALTYFMNGIPTVEISRAVPFVDIVLIQQGSHLTGDDNRISSLSMGQFLLGNASVTNEQTAAYLSANDSEVVYDNANNPEFEPTSRTGPDGSTTSTPVPISTAGMELFTAPQTLVPANEMHQETDAAETTVEGSLRRSASVMDRFRPLMSLKSVSFSVVPSGGMMCYKSGKISLTLHDKSRLAEVAALVRPARYGTTHLQIEYGWAHPAAQPQRWGSSDLGTEINNLIGQFIGNLRVKEKYQVVNSTFSFDDAGQVEIELTISMLAQRAANQVNIGLGFESTSEYQNLVHFTQMIEQIRGRLSEYAAAAITGEGDSIGSLSSPTSALSLSSETINQINRLARTLGTAGGPPELRELGTALRDMLGTVRGSGDNTTVDSNGVIGRARESIASVITNRVASLYSTPDPFFLKTRANGTGGSKEINETNYVSLGKIIAGFVGSTIAQSGNYKDVQIIFYSFNDKASYMSNKNIASFPINKRDFQDVLRTEMEQLINMNVAAFMSFLSTYFLHDPGADAYGFNALYGERSEEDRSTRQLNERYNSTTPGTRGRENLSENSAALFDAQQRVLRHAYGVTGEGEFKAPTVQALMETVPVGRGTEETSASVTGTETILRIHIFDSQASSHATLQSFLEASMSSNIGTLNSRAQSLIASIGTPTSGDSSTSSSTESPSGSPLADFYSQLNAAQRAGIIEPWPPTSEGTAGRADILRPEGGSRYRMRGGFSNLKNFIMSTMPSMRYGQGASGVLSAKVTSQSDSALSTVNMLRQARSPDTPAGARASGLPLQVAPVECNLETIGCPLWNFGQQIFIDFGTGTTIDAIYGVTGVDHTIDQSGYKTSVKLTPMNSYARYQSMFNQIENAFSTIDGMTNSNDDD